jgi:hypothetical protein
VGYLPNTADPVPLVLDLRIAQTNTGVFLTLVLMDIYVILMIYIGPLMRLLLTRSESIDLTTTITLLTLYHLYLLLLVRLGGYIANLSDFYSCRLIGKLTAFLQLQEFSLRKPTVVCSTSAARFSLSSSKVKLVWFSLRQKLYVLRLI